MSYWKFCNLSNRFTKDFKACLNVQNPLTPPPLYSKINQQTLIGLSLFCFSFHSFFFPAILFFSCNYFTQYFAHYLAIFLLIKGFFLMHLQLLSMHDCCIRVIHSHGDFSIRVSLSFSCFSRSICWFNPVCNYSSRVSPSLQCKID